MKKVSLEAICEDGDADDVADCVKDSIRDNYSGVLIQKLVRRPEN